MKSPVLVSLIILTYNQEAYVREAIEGGFSQTYSPLEIIISDDYSSDRTFQIVEDLVNAYNGPHDVRCSRNLENLGISKHLTHVLSLANGELIVGAAGDDISIPERVDSLVKRYISSERTINYFYSLAQEITINGTLKSVVSSPGSKNGSSKWLAALSPYPIAIGATQAWTRLLSNSFPPMAENVWAEDQVLGVRGLLLGPICCIHEPLVLYRVGSGISTKKEIFTVRKYFMKKVDSIHMYKQRCVDAWHVKEYLLSLIVATKVLMLYLTLPFSPIISLATKLKSSRHH